ncbi:Nsp1-like C-terminal region-domain-containing protein, partial [Blyttiomyces helicus]
MEDILNKWKTQLDTYTKEFHKQALEVRRWDYAILENGAKISRLCEQLQSAENIQKEIDQSFDLIEAQQNELDTTLDNYTKEIKQLIEGGPDGQGRLRGSSADEEREKAYAIAENLNQQLDDLSHQLTSLIDDVNATRMGTTPSSSSSSAADADAELDDANPVAAIVRILSEHLSSLEWLDENAADLTARVQELTRAS